MNRQKILALIGLILGLILIVYTPQMKETVMTDNWHIENNITYELLGNTHLTYDGVGHKQLTVMGGRYTVSSNFNLFEIFCYGADMTIKTQMKPASIFSVGCNIHFEKPSYVRAHALLVGSKVTGTLNRASTGAFIASYPDAFIYYSLWLFRHPYSFVIGTLLLIGGLLALIKPLTIPERLLHLRGALWSVPMLLGGLALLYIIATVFFVSTGLQEGDMEMVSIGLYIHIAVAWIMYLLALFATYFMLSYQRGYMRYYPLVMGGLSPFMYGLPTLMLLLMSLIGFVYALVIPDLWRAKYLLKDYTRTSEIRKVWK